MSIISIRNLKKSYENHVILENIDLDVHAGEVISIIGPSGTGKSTLLRAINYLDPPTEGNIFFKGEEITKKNVDIIRKKMNMVFQNFGLFSHLNVMENLLLGQISLLNIFKKEATEKAMRILKMVGLGERAYFYPNKLSGGQKQRVAIARCLAMEPEVILFDEPTSALDPTMVSEVMSVMRNLAKSGMTMLVVTHEMDFAREVSSRVLYIDENTIYEQGTPDEIFYRPTNPKTKSFIYNIRSFHWEIKSSNFDYAELLGTVENFCFRNGIENKIANSIQLMVEELVINIVTPIHNQCDIKLNYSEKLDTYELTVSYPGPKSNILEKTEDDLSLTIVKKTAKNINFEHFEGKNIITVDL